MKIYYSLESGVGSTKVMQALPNEGLRQISPFLLLHHIGPTIIPPGQDALGVGSHPHRGFEPVTFLFKGGLEHRDSMGNIGHLNDGDVQWMTSGSGVLHSEHSHPEFKKSGGQFHMVQLWINLPKAHKMTEPRYQDMRDADIPRFSLGSKGSYGRLISGMLDGHIGPADTFTPLNAIHVIAETDDQFDIVLEPGFNSFIYMLSGAVSADDQQLVQHQLGILDEGTRALSIKSNEKSEFFILSGQPINEPLSTYGPFVMNTPEELNQAIRDFQNGKMGVLD